MNAPRPSHFSQVGLAQGYLLLALARGVGQNQVWLCGAGKARTTQPDPKSGGAGDAVPLLAKPFGEEREM